MEVIIPRKDCANGYLVSNADSISNCTQKIQYWPYFVILRISIYKARCLLLGCCCCFSGQEYVSRFISAVPRYSLASITRVSLQFPTQASSFLLPFVKHNEQARVVPQHIAPRRLSRPRENSQHKRDSVHCYSVAHHLAAAAVQRAGPDLRSVLITVLDLAHVHAARAPGLELCGCVPAVFFTVGNLAHGNGQGHEH